ncbi:MAG TPA: Rieske 2Fe-2S domain-containing protein [Ktedonobacteraceae bacterium]|nr:Rieske 2Fe-2S domain-containing protein [Ktedonobacteraceae bacterium]
MSGEDQERFEDYLELEQYIEDLQAGRVAHPPAELTPSQASIYRMAALFRSASPEAEEPGPEFVANLQQRLEQEIVQSSKTEHLPRMPGSSAGQKQPRKLAVSRRALLTGGAAVAASLAVGTGVGAMVERSTHPPSTPPTANTGPWGLVDKNVATYWHPVISVAELGANAVPFAVDTVVGYIIRNDGDDNFSKKGEIVAVSAACTHMGCIVKWHDSDRKFHCPCHGGLFTEYGMVDKSASAILYIRALPRLNTKVENGHVYVEVPKSQ